MAIEFEHIKTLEDLGIAIKDYPKTISGHIYNFKQLEKKYITDVPPDQQDPARIRELKVKSAVIADAMIDYYESLKEDEDMLNDAQKTQAKELGLDPETTTVDQLTAAITAAQTKQAELAARAKAVGLTETATEAQIIAAEAKAANEAEKEKQARLAKLKELGLKEDATDEEIEAAVKAKITPTQQKHYLDELLDEIL